MKSQFIYSLAYILLAALMTACSTNPVTGKSELSLVSTEQEIQLGQQKYAPYRQTQGGDYVADPEVQRYVEEVGQRLAAVSDRKLPYEFRVINDSSPNAWALPGGKIAVNRGLLVELENEAQLAAVMGHEIVHAAAKHTAQGMQRDLLLQGALIATGIALSDSEYRGAALAGAKISAGLADQKYGRDAEREADYYGMFYMNRAGYNPAEAVGLQKTFLRLSKDRKSDWLSGLFASHPPSQERVSNNQKTVIELNNPGGELGRERYQKKIARLLKTKPAYKAYDEALALVKKEDHAKALQLLNKAIKLEPKEALFHGLQGEILAIQGKNKKARQELDKAVALNPDYFKNYLARGFVLRDLGDKRGAQRDFEQSLKLLPTTEGQYGLGRLAMDNNQRDVALGYFRKASASNTAVGKSAGIYLARLDLPNNPGRYIKSSVALDRDGYLNVVIKNTSEVTVSNVSVVIGKKLSFGIQQAGAFQLRQNLEPYQGLSIRTNIGPISAKQAGGLTTMVTKATIIE